MQLSIRLENSLLERLEDLSKQTGRSKTFYVKEAIAEKLDDIEDMYMAKKALSRIKAGKSKIVSLEEVKVKNGL
jgi:RHH-type rel operon transcriptional repressor/antitoxin RelB